MELDWDIEFDHLDFCSDILENCIFSWKFYHSLFVATPFIENKAKKIKFKREILNK